MTKECHDFCWDEIASIEEIDEEQECYDITLLEDDVYISEPNFIANDFVVHNCGMHNTYCSRKRKEEKYKLHPLLKPILGSTYGVMVFQEQVLKILHVVGGIPDMHCEKVRKAISKKKVAAFSKYKEMFVRNGQINLGVSEEEVKGLWAQIEAFADYGFNKSMDIDTLIPTTCGTKRLGDCVAGDIVYGVNEYGDTIEVEVVAVHDHGTLDAYEITFDDGSTEICSQDHKFLTEQGQISIREIRRTNTAIYCDQRFKEFYGKVKERRLANEVRSYSSDESRMVPTTPGHAGITDTRGLVLRQVVRVVPVGKRRMYDLEVSSSTHNFLLTNGIVTSNSHSYAYSFITSRQLALMAHYPIEFYTSVLMCENDAANIKEIKIDALMHGIELAPLHINKSKVNFSIQKDDDGKEKIFYGFSNLQKVGDKVGNRIIGGQPYTSFEDFLERFGSDGTAIKALVSLDAFREGDRLQLYKFAEYWKDWNKKFNAAQSRFADSLKRSVESLENLLEEYRHVITNESHFKTMMTYTEEAYELWERYFSNLEEEETSTSKGVTRKKTITVLKKFHDLRRKREKTITNRTNKDEVLLQDGKPMLKTFNAQQYKSVLDDDVVDLLTAPISQAEKEYYGYAWVSEIEKSPDYDGFTIDKFLAEEKQGGCIEVQIEDVEKVKSKKGDNYYYVLKVSDANGRDIMVTMWQDDYTRFQSDLKPGNLVKMRVTPPEGSWKRWSFETVKRHERRFLPRNKDDDHRLCIMRAPDVGNQDMVNDVNILLEN